MKKEKTKEEINSTVEIRNKYSCYKTADIAVKLFLNGVKQEDIDYIMQGGDPIKMKPYSTLQKWLDGAMNRMEETLGYEETVKIRQNSACCLVGVRDNLAKKIFKENNTIEKRFEALSKERRIIGGNAWKNDNNYFITFWYAKPVTGYTCGCLRCIPDKPMNKLWCECCAGHIKHHFETALGVKATCTCLHSVLSSCGQEPCLFKLNIIEEK